MAVRTDAVDKAKIVLIKRYLWEFLLVFIYINYYKKRPTLALFSSQFATSSYPEIDDDNMKGTL